MNGAARPRTAVLIEFAGMGDLVWHVPYFRRVAETSADGQVTVITPPSTQARELVGHEPWVREIVDIDRRPRRAERRRGRHSGLDGLLRLGAELAPKRLERIVLFTRHPMRPLVAAWRAGIPERIGFGQTALQRLLLTRTAWIERYHGPANPHFQEATAFARAQGWCDGPIAPRLTVRPEALERARARVANLPTPLHALAIGASEPYKQWGAENFAALANQLAERGRGVVLMGGPAEGEVARAVLAGIEPALRAQVLAVLDGSVAETVATMSLATSCVGNDTGASNIAAAVGTPTWVVLGAAAPLEHDPATMHMLRAPGLADIRPDEVALRALQGA